MRRRPETPPWPGVRTEGQADEGDPVRIVALSAVLTVLAVALLAGALWTWAGHRHDGPDDAPSEGALAPGFSMPSVRSGGGTISLARFEGYVVVLNFWASWCEPCRQEAPGLRAVSEEYGARGVRFIGVDERDNRVDAVAFLNEFSLTYPNVFDPSGILSQRYRLIGLPATVIVDGRGVIVERFLGSVEEDRLRETLQTELERTQGGSLAG